MLAISVSLHMGGLLFFTTQTPSSAAMSSVIAPLQVNVVIVPDSDAEGDVQPSEVVDKQNHESSSAKVSHDADQETASPISAEITTIQELVAPIESIVVAPQITPQAIVQKENKRVPNKPPSKAVTRSYSADYDTNHKNDAKPSNSKPSKQTATHAKKSTGGNKSTGESKISGSQSSGFTDAVIKTEPQKCYPKISQMRGEKGIAVLRIHIDSKGDTSEISFTQSTGFPKLDECAKQAVAKSKYYPALQSGIPVSSTRLVKIVFEP